MSFKDVLFSFEGRMRRRDWWLVTIGLGVFNYAVTQIIAPLALGAEGRPQMEYGMMFPSYPGKLVLVLVGVTLLTAWPNFAIAIKRAHDRNEDGMPTAMMLGLSMALGWIPILLMNNYPILFIILVMLIGFGIGIYLLVVLGILDGTKGPNRFGPSPKGVTGPVVNAADQFS